MPVVPRANELLGYPADARLLIVNADDFGMCHGQNLGAIRSMTEGLVSSCSLMAPTPWCLHAADFLGRHPEVSFAVHLTIVSEYRHYRWGPLAAPASVPSLLDESGYFFGDDRFDHMLDTADIGELETEFRAQIEAIKALGLEPSHLDTHYGPHEFRQDIFDLVVQLAREYGLAMRAGSLHLVERLLAQGLPATEHGVLDSGRIPPEQKAEVLAARLRELPAGLSEWALHPGIATDELRAIMADPRVPGVTGTPEGRQSDFDVAVSEEAARIVDEEGIQIIGYREVQRAWQAVS
ncbi:MAG: polysaccharide deacetylase family protein [Chloroflexota bacterium]|nr:polysaccharide deacetylase family protein [Chloroflexota bacterium]MDE2918514.1 polysaccharide deacetylase family protein [Chloroflexota bacterium]